MDNRSVSIVGGGSMSSNQQNEVQELPQHQNENIAEGSPMLNNNSPTAIPVDDGDNVSSRVGGAATEKLGVSAAASNDDNAVASPSDPNVNNVTYDGGNTEQEEEGEEGNQNDDNGEEDDVADDESDYSYAYEDDESATFGGFLEPVENHNNIASLSNGGGGNDGVNLVAEDSAAAAAAAAKKPADLPRTISRAASNLSTSSPPTIPETNPGDNERKQKWREPTRAAVNMSLRAEKEKTGGRRRLASDLYKIMMADTKEAGFSLEPADEDSMEKWCIKLFDFDEDSCLAKDLLVCNLDHVELEMSFPDQYPFEPPFVRVTKPRFKRQTGFVMSGAICMELLTKDGWNPINDIESVIVSIRSLMVVGGGRIEIATEMPKDAYKKALAAALVKKKAPKDSPDVKLGDADKRKRSPSDDENDTTKKEESKPPAKKASGGSYTTSEAKSAYNHLSSYHKKEGWDKSGWWSRKG